MIEVVVNTNTFSRGTSGNVIGEIFLRGCQGEFPENRWSDFPVIILAWWIDGLKTVIMGRTDLYVGMFMEGPFAFVIERSSGVTGRVSWGKADEPQPIEEIDINDLLDSAISAGRQVVAACHARDWSNADLNALETAVSRSAA